MTGFEPATTRPPDAYSNRTELHPVPGFACLRVQRYDVFCYCASVLPKIFQKNVFFLQWVSKIPFFAAFAYCIFVMQCGWAGQFIYVLHCWFVVGDTVVFCRWGCMQKINALWVAGNAGVCFVLCLVPMWLLYYSNSIILLYTNNLTLKICGSLYILFPLHICRVVNND